MKNRIPLKQILGISFYALLSVVFSSCSEMDNSKGYVIEYYHSYGNKCKYTAYQHGSWNIKNITFVDDADKFSIGDTVYISRRKNY